MGNHVVEMRVWFWLMILVLLVSGCTGEPANGKVLSPTGPEASAEPELGPAPVSCKDECGTDTCDGFDFILCKEQPDGCYDRINNGVTIGKCGAECRSDSYCSDNEECDNYKCISKPEPEPETEPEPELELEGNCNDATRALFLKNAYIIESAGREPQAGKWYHNELYRYTDQEGLTTESGFTSVVCRSAKNVGENTDNLYCDFLIDCYKHTDEGTIIGYAKFMFTTGYGIGEIADMPDTISEYETFSELATKFRETTTSPSTTMGEVMVESLTSKELTLDELPMITVLIIYIDENPNALQDILDGTDYTEEDLIDKGNSALSTTYDDEKKVNLSFNYCNTKMIIKDTLHECQSTAFGR